MQSSLQWAGSATNNVESLHRIDSEAASCLLAEIDTEAMRAGAATKALDLVPAFQSTV